MRNLGEGYCPGEGVIPEVSGCQGFGVPGVRDARGFWVSGVAGRRRFLGAGGFWVPGIPRWQRFVSQSKLQADGPQVSRCQGFRVLELCAAWDTGIE